MDFEQLPIASVEGVIFHKKDFFFRSKLENYANHFQEQFFAALKKNGIEREFNSGIDDQGVIKLSEKNQPFNAVTLSENSIGFSLAWVSLSELETMHAMFKFLAENLRRFRAEGEKLVWDFFGMRFSLVFPFLKPNAAQIIRETFFNDVSFNLEKVTTNKETDLVDFHIATKDQQMRYRVRVDSSLDKKVITTRFEIEKPFGVRDTDISFSIFTLEAIRFYKEAFRPFAERLIYNPEFNESFFRTFF
jgi:hypothetical protein